MLRHMHLFSLPVALELLSLNCFVFFLLFAYSIAILFYDFTILRAVALYIVLQSFFLRYILCISPPPLMYTCVHLAG